jgi:hypothetical protein
MRFVEDVLVLVTLRLAIIVIVWTTPIYAATARLLLFSATQRFRHASIPTAIRVLQERGASIDVEFDATEDASLFTDANLAKYDALVFLSTTGEGVGFHPILLREPN